MATLLVPPLDAEPWPTLGPEVCAFLEAYGRYGPGELAGKEYEVTSDFRAQLYRAYEVYPRGHRLAGRRRFKRVALEERKGLAKTERAMLVAFVESHPEGPVRCDGFRKDGTPIGVPVRHPYIPLVSYTVDQTEDLGYLVLRQILEESPLADDYDIGLDRILVLDHRGREAGKIVPLAGSPNARDGARTTFQHFDEPHRMTLPRLVKAHTTMLENIYKRVGADAWTLETTTAGEPGENSVAEQTRETAEAIDRGEVADPQLFFFSRFAPIDMPLETPEQVRAALLEATGPNIWSGDIDALVPRYFEPKTDRSYYRRVWLNQWLAGAGKAFDPILWRSLAKKRRLPAKARVTLGLDGSRRKDATALVATTLRSRHQVVLGIWQRPANADDEWEIPADDVDEAVTAAFEQLDVVLFYADPPYWDEWISAWAGRYGTDRVKKWWTNRDKPMAYALAAYRDAMLARYLSHDGDERMAEHIANAHKHALSYLDEQGQPLWTIRKDRADSPRKIDAAMAGCLSWEARNDAVALGALKTRKSRTLRTR